MPLKRDSYNVCPYQQTRQQAVIHRGIMFDCVLDAQWAVFFDTLGVQYRYKPEQFDLTEKYISLWQRALRKDNEEEEVDDELFYYTSPRELEKGERVLYTPTFYLPSLEKYIDIKPYGGEDWCGGGYDLLFYVVCFILGGYLVHGIPSVISDVGASDPQYEIRLVGDEDHYFGYCPVCRSFKVGFLGWKERICAPDCPSNEYYKTCLTDGEEIAHAAAVAMATHFRVATN